MYSGSESYDQISKLCKENGTSISALLLKYGMKKSVGTSLKTAKKPNFRLALAASMEFGVPINLLTGTDHEPDSDGKELELTKKERELVVGLRNASPVIQDVIYKIISSVLPYEPKIADSFFLKQKDSKSHQASHTSKAVLGTAAAGTPITAVPEEEASVPVPQKYLESRFFVVRATGESMINAGISDGAYCVFNSEGHVDEGQIVLAQVEGPTDQPEVTIKKVYCHGSEIELRPENPAFDSMFYPADSVRITGVLVDVLPPEA